MKKDFERNPNKRRDDSPLRWPANVHHTTTHNERIRWLWYENSKMYEELFYENETLLPSINKKILLLKHNKLSSNFINEFNHLIKNYNNLNNKELIFVFKNIINNNNA